MRTLATNSLKTIFKLQQYNNICNLLNDFCKKWAKNHVQTTKTKIITYYIDLLLLNYWGLNMVFSSFGAKSIRKVAYLVLYYATYSMLKYGASTMNYEQMSDIAMVHICYLETCLPKKMSSYWKIFLRLKKDTQASTCTKLQIKTLD